MSVQRISPYLLSIFGLAVAAACSSLRGEGGDAEDGLPTNSGGTASGAGGSTTVPPEQELEENFKAPVVTRSLLFSANPASSRVAVIDGASLEVKILEAGHEPTFLAALPEGETNGGALVLNVRSHDAMAYLLPPDADLNDLQTRRAPVQNNANAWAVGRGGRFAIAWSRVAATAESGSDGFQDITVLEPGTVPLVATRLGVGFRPSAIFVADDEERAVVVSDPGLSVLELGPQGTSGIVVEYPLPPASASTQRDVSVTPNGLMALVRLDGQPSVLAMNLATGDSTRLAMPGIVTDLDLGHDGRLAVAVVRADGLGTGGSGMGGQGGNAGEGGQAPEGGAPADDDSATSRVVLLDIASSTAAPRVTREVEVPDSVGSASLTPNGEVALLFSNALDNPRIWILQTSTGELRVLDVRSPIRAVLPTPDGLHAVAILAPPAGSTRQGAFALVPLTKDLPARIEGTNAPTAQVAFSPSGRHVLITTRAEGATSAEAFSISLPNLSVDRLELPSLPLAAGVIGPLEKGFVAQEHPEGRLTFVDFTSGAVTTLTGYELGSSVVE